MSSSVLGCCELHVLQGWEESFLGVWVARGDGDATVGGGGNLGEEAVSSLQCSQQWGVACSRGPGGWAGRTHSPLPSGSSDSRHGNMCLPPQALDVL